MAVVLERASPNLLIEIADGSMKLPVFDRAMKKGIIPPKSNTGLLVQLSPIAPSLHLSDSDLRFHLTRRNAYLFMVSVYSFRTSIGYPTFRTDEKTSTAIASAVGRA